MTSHGLFMDKPLLINGYTCVYHISWLSPRPKRRSRSACVLATTTRPSCARVRATFAKRLVSGKMPKRWVNGMKTGKCLVHRFGDGWTDGKVENVLLFGCNAHVTYARQWGLSSLIPNGVEWTLWCLLIWQQKICIFFRSTPSYL
jgi:hypothetical protein